MDTMKLGYASSSNISMHGTWDTGILREEWNEMSDDEKDEVYQQAADELLDLWEENE